MKQLVGFTEARMTSNGDKVTIVDFVLNTNTEETFAVCLHRSGKLVQIRIDRLENVHYENI